MKRIHLLAALAATVLTLFPSGCAVVRETYVNFESLHDPLVQVDVTIPLSFSYTDTSVSQTNVIFAAKIREGLGKALTVVSDLNAPGRIILDSLVVGEMYTDNVVYVDEYNDKASIAVEVSRPFSFRMQFALPDTTVTLFFDDILEWSIVPPDTLSAGMANLAAKRYFPSSVSYYGETISDLFFPYWDEDSRMIYTCRDWEAAEEYARNFYWEDAREIWMRDTGTNNIDKNFAAAYNVAVSYEMMEEYEIALQWLDYIDKYFPERKSVTLRKRCEAKLGREQSKTP